MPQFRTAHVFESRDLRIGRTVCNGCDPLRPCEEHNDYASLWLVTSGALELRDRRGLRVIDPTRGLVVPAYHAFTVRHPAGPDVCVWFRGPLVDALASAGLATVPITPAFLARLASALGEDHPDELSVGELLATLVPDDPTSSPRDLASAVAHQLRVGFAASTSLTELAASTGYSVFHTCRVFQRATGHTIHGFRRELRLRHALARVLDGDEPLADVAAATGFASQSHLTNLFRARFGITPGRARTRAGQRLLAHAGT
ncbi:MAG TPA: helix-turn-helix transcriptional regulator [Kofleriaceae bacterium]|nr:helix-turn-helix transcriptional regulator [Kofleriaceae bacterium]